MLDLLSYPRGVFLTAFSTVYTDFPVGRGGSDRGGRPAEERRALVCRQRLGTGAILGFRGSR